MSRVFNSSAESTLKVIAHNLDKPIAVQEKHNYIFHNHAAINAVGFGVTGNSSIFICPTVQIFRDETTGAIGSFFAPTVNQIFHVVSTNIADNGGGVGLRSILVYYLNATSPQLQNQVVVLNGTTPQPLLSAMWRIVRVVPLTVGATGWNVGEIRFTDSTDTLIYPGVMAPLSNKFHTPLLSTPVGISKEMKFNGTIQMGQVRFNYIHYAINNLGVGDTFRVYGRIIQGGSALPWFKINEFVNGSNTEFQIPTSMAKFNAVGSAFDFAFVVQIAGPGLVSPMAVIGYHVE